MAAGDQVLEAIAALERQCRQKIAPSEADAERVAELLAEARKLVAELVTAGDQVLEAIAALERQCQQKIAPSEADAERVADLLEEVRKLVAELPTRDLQIDRGW